MRYKKLKPVKCSTVMEASDFKGLFNVDDSKMTQKKIQLDLSRKDFNTFLGIKHGDSPFSAKVTVGQDPDLCIMSEMMDEPGSKLKSKPAYFINYSNIFLFLCNVEFLALVNPAL